MRRGAQPFLLTLAISAPIMDSGSMMRFMGRFWMDASPVRVTSKFWAARMDPCGQFNVTEPYFTKETEESKPEKFVNPSEIYSKVFAETEIKKEHKVHDDKLKTPTVMDFGNYLCMFRNDTEGEGYNVSFKFSVDKMVQDEQQGAKEGEMVEGFLTFGIRLSTALLLAGEEPHLRDERGRITKNPAPMLTIRYMDGGIDRGGAGDGGADRAHGRKSRVSQREVWLHAGAGADEGYQFYRPSGPEDCGGGQHRSGKDHVNQPAYAVLRGGRRDDRSGMDGAGVYQSV